MSLPAPLEKKPFGVRVKGPPSPRGSHEGGTGSGGTGSGGAGHGEPPGRWVRFGSVLRRHVGFLVVLAAGLVLRILVLIAYPQAFWYTDSTRYEFYSHGWQIDFARQAGYSLVLKALRQTGSLYSVSALQHLLGLAVAVAIYVLLQRRSVPRWLSILAVLPLVGDGFQLTFEHYVLAETVFTTLVAAGLLALVWSSRLSVWSAGVAGLLLALSATVRAVSLPLVVVTVGYFILRRPGWRPATCYVLCAALPLLGYVFLFHEKYDQYNLSTIQGSFLYGRVAPIADCEHLRLTPAQRTLCPQQPVGERPLRSDWYIFSATSPARGATMRTQQGFAFAVFRQQPGDVAWAIATDVGRYLVPTEVQPDWRCVTEGTLLPAVPPGPDYEWCKPNPRQAFAEAGNPATQPGATLLTRTLGRYAHLVQTPKLLLGACVILVLAALAWRPRRHPQHGRVCDIALLGAWGLGLIVLGVAGSMFDERYGMPSLAILPAAAALALHRLAENGCAGTRADLNSAGRPLSIRQEDVASGEDVERKTWSADEPARGSEAAGHATCCREAIASTFVAENSLTNRDPGGGTGPDPHTCPAGRRP